MAVASRDDSTLAKPEPRRRFRGVDADERQNQRRQRLLEAGIELFGARGFHAVGVRDICQQAKLTERYFYESFKNREALFVAVYEQAVERLRGAILEALGRAPSHDGLALAKAGLRATLEMYRADPRLARILLVEVLTASIGEAPRAAGRTYAELIEQLIRELHPDAEQRGTNVRFIATGLYGSTLLIATRWALDGYREPLEVVLDHCARFYESLIHDAERRAASQP